MAFVPPEEFVPTLPHGILHASAFFTDSRDRPLLLASAYHAGEHQFPGGLLDADEDPWECAVRETGEEIGFVPAALGAPRLLAVSFTPPEQPWPWSIGLLFDGGRLTDEEIARITLSPEEHTGHAIHTVEQWSTIVGPWRMTTLHACLTARRTGVPAYLYAGDRGATL
jgi:8-oxo-dGTP pyrophosphatase MutT (NUDIX family)